MVLVAAGLCSIPGAECSKASLQTSWSRCMAILEHHKPQIPSASHASQVLETLQHRVAFAGNEGKHEPLNEHEQTIPNPFPCMCLPTNPR
jgi:hypothetical protein